MKKFYYILKDGYYYRPKSSGYTEYKLQAGVYPQEEAEKHKEHCEDLRLEEIDIEQHNNVIQKEIDSLKGRRI